MGDELNLDGLSNEELIGLLSPAAKAKLAGVDIPTPDYSSPEMDTKAAAADIVAQDSPSILDGITNAGYRGALFGFNDELAGAGEAMSGGPDAALIGDLTTEINRASQNRFAAEHPYLNFGSTVAGGVLTSPILAAKTMLGMAGLGAAQGGLTGFGEGEQGAFNRLLSAGVGAGTGAAAGVVAPIVVKGVARGGQAIMDALDTAGSVATQRGAIGTNIGNILSRKGDLAPEEALALKLLKDQTPETIAAMKQTLLEGQSQGTPLVAADVMGPTGRSVADYLANVSPEGMEIAPGVLAPRDFLNARVAEQPGRMRNLIADLSPEPTADMADAAARKIAQEAEAGFKQMRTDVSRPLYEQVGEYAVTPELNSALVKPATNQVIDEILSNPILAEEFKGKSLTDPSLLIEARRRLGVKAGMASMAGDKQIAQKYMQAKDLLNSAMETQPEFTLANEAYKEASKPLNQLFGNDVTGDPGMIAQLLETKGMTSKNAGEIILQMSPEQIAQTKTLLGDKGTKLMRAGVKSFVMDLAGRTKAGTTGAERNLANTLDSRDAIIAALGDEEAAKLFKKVGFEKLVTQSAGNYAANSKTAGRQEAAKYFESMTPKLRELGARAFNPTTWGGIADDLLSMGEDEQLKKAASKLLFDPYSSAQFFTNRGQLAQDLAARNQATNALIQYLAPKAAALGSTAASGTAARGLKK